MRSLLYTALLMFFPFLAFSQNQSITDSLKQFLKSHTVKDSIYIDGLNQLAYEYYLGDPKKAIELAYEAKGLSKEINYLKGEAQAYRQMGLVFWAQGNFPQALDHFLDGLRIAESANSLQTIADITGNIGLVYQGLEDYSQATGFHEKSLSLQRKLKNKMRESVALNNLGDIKRAQKEYDAAIEYYSLALKLRQETHNLNGQATNIRNLGNIYEEQQMFDKALERYFESMKISDSQNERSGMSQCRYSIASVYFKTKRYDKAKEVALKSLEISKLNNYRAYIRNACLLLSQITEAQKNIDESLQFFKLYSSYKDSVMNSQIRGEIAAQHLEYETQKKQTEIDILKKDAALQQSEIMQKNTLLVSIAITLALLALLSIILFQNYSRQKDINRVLKNKNEEIEKQSMEIAEKRDELIALNEEIRAQQEEVMASRDILAEKNISIEQMNQQILEINENLERIVSQRTSALEKQNQQMIEYAFINAHKLRAPLARILGLVHLVGLANLDEEQRKIVGFLTEAAAELDEVTKSINQVLQEGLDASQHKS